MSDRSYAKVIVSGEGASLEEYRQRLARLAHPGVDVGLLQITEHQAVVRPHLLRHLMARTGKAADQLLADAGAAGVEMITDEEVVVLAQQRASVDLPPRPAAVAGPGWHLEWANVPAAWDAVGGPDTIAWGGIAVGQIDTGYTRHIAFGHAEGDDSGSWMRADSTTIMFQDVPAEFGILPEVASGNGIDPMPFGALFKGHGTRIGSTISGWAQTPDGIFRGVAPKVPHVMVRIADSVALNTRQRELVAALDYLVNTARVDVINISLGIFPPIASKEIVKAMAAARSKGVIVVCAAGNHVDPVVVPARLDTAIAVGGVALGQDEDGNLQMRPWSGSSFGPEVDFSAPAADIRRAMPVRKGLGATFGDDGDGTSYAAAITTGSAALWLLRWRGQINAMYGKTARRVDAFRQAVQATSTQPKDWQPTPFGAGVLNTGRLCTEMQKALPLIAGAPPLPPVPVGAVVEG